MTLVDRVLALEHRCKQLELELFGTATMPVHRPAPERDDIGDDIGDDPGDADPPRDPMIKVQG